MGLEQITDLSREESMAVLESIGLPLTQEFFARSYNLERRFGRESMKLFIAIMATALLVSVASAANQYAEESTKLKDVVSTSFGLAAFRPSVTMTDGQIHITLSPTQIGDYPTLMDVRAIIELYYKTLDGTGYAGSLVLVIKNLDGIGAYRWDVRPYSKDDFDAQPNYVIDNMLMLNPGPEGVGGSSAWIYTDPNYVGSKLA